MLQAEQPHGGLRPDGREREVRAISIDSMLAEASKIEDAPLAVGASALGLTCRIERLID